jgi:hypothetical protein
VDLFRLVFLPKNYERVFAGGGMMQVEGAAKEPVIDDMEVFDMSPKSKLQMGINKITKEKAGLSGKEMLGDFKNDFNTTNLRRDSAINLVSGHIAPRQFNMPIRRHHNSSNSPKHHHHSQKH